MFIETLTQRTLRSSGARPQFGRLNIALLQSAGLNLSNGSYKHLAALRPGRLATFVARPLYTRH
jgi:hypothetical protein